MCPIVTTMEEAERKKIFHIAFQVQVPANQAGSGKMLQRVLQSSQVSASREKSDLKIVCADGVEFHVHKSLLGFFSPFFWNMMQPGPSFVSPLVLSCCSSSCI